MCVNSASTVLGGAEANRRFLRLNPTTRSSRVRRGVTESRSGCLMERFEEIGLLDITHLSPKFFRNNHYPGNFPYWVFVDKQLTLIAFLYELRNKDLRRGTYDNHATVLH